MLFFDTSCRQCQSDQIRPGKTRSEQTKISDCLEADNRFKYRWSNFISHPNGRWNLSRLCSDRNISPFLCQPAEQTDKKSFLFGHRLLRCFSYRKWKVRMGTLYGQHSFNSKYEILQVSVAGFVNNPSSNFFFIRSRPVKTRLSI
jgi:hypothetical protein